MPEYLSPGVYIEETSYRAKPIQGVSTSTAGFVGAASKGVEGTATLVTSMGQFRRRFGSPISPSVSPGDYLGHAVKAFFDNGGSRVYIVRALAADATASAIQLHQGTILRLADGVTVRGPTRVIPLNSLRTVADGSVLRVHTRASSSDAFVAGGTLTVESHDANRNRITVIPADEIANGDLLDPDNTYFTIIGGPALTAGATFSARNRGIDGDNISVLIRLTDLTPVSLVVPSVSRNQPVVDTLAGHTNDGETSLGISAAGLRRLRSGDQIAVGTAEPLTIQSIAASTVDFMIDNISAGDGNFETNDVTFSLLQRAGGATLTGNELALGVFSNASANMNFDALAAPPVAHSVNDFPHDIAALLNTGDVLVLDDGASTVQITITNITFAAAPNVTLDGVTPVTPAQDDASVRLLNTSDTNPDFIRLYVNDVSGFNAPYMDPAVSLEGITVSDGTNVEPAEILLVDSATSSLLVSKANPAVAGEFTDQVNSSNWKMIDGLFVAALTDDTVAVANTGSFYSGAVVELDLGASKRELIVQSVDTEARTVTFTTPIGADVQVDPDPANRITSLRTAEIDILILENDVIVETFERLTWSTNTRNTSTDAYNHNYIERLNDPEIGSSLVSITPPGAPGDTLSDQPTNQWGFATALQGGGNGSALGAVDLIGQDNGPGQRTGIQALAERDNISIVAVPGVVDENVQAALITHCERLKYRIAVLDGPQNTHLVSDLQAHRNNYDTKYAAMYAPWLMTLDLSNGKTIPVPPCGHVAGIYARTDNTVGVWKAPANEVVRNITDVEIPFTKGEQDVLNPIGVNLIRDLTPRSIRVWGARTLTSDQEWKYVNVRRLFIFLEHSIDIGTQWVVFEPNSEALWARVTETINAFLTSVWKSGALMGTKPEEAFFITCDRSTMTQSDIDNGRLICEIGIAPVYPAEFVIFRIGQFTANS